MNRGGGVRAFRRVGLLSLAGWLFISGCSATLPEYSSARDRWTESQSVYRQIELQAQVHATFKTALFRRQYVREFARLFALRARQRQALLKQELAEAATRYVFVVILSTKKLSWNNLDREAKIWRVQLANRKGKAVAPTSVRELDRDNPTWQVLFPKIGTQYRIWELKFPRTSPDGQPLVSSGQHLDLIIAGAPAQMKLTWKAP